MVVRSQGCLLLARNCGGRAYVIARLIEGAIAAQHCCIVCEPGEQLRPTRRCSRRAKSGARLNSSIVGRHYERSLTPIFGLASFVDLAFSAVAFRSNVAGYICHCSQRRRRRGETRSAFALARHGPWPCSVVCPSASSNAVPTHQPWRWPLQRSSGQTRAPLWSCGPRVTSCSRAARAVGRHQLARFIERVVAAQRCCIVCEPGQQLRPTRRCSRRAKSGARLNSSIVGRRAN